MSLNCVLCSKSINQVVVFIVHTRLESKLSNVLKVLFRTFPKPSTLVRVYAMNMSVLSLTGFQMDSTFSLSSYLFLKCWAVQLI